jgi:hypothetical protein
VILERLSSAVFSVLGRAKREQLREGVRARRRARQRERDKKRERERERRCEIFDMSAGPGPSLAPEQPDSRGCDVQEPRAPDK